MTTLKLDGAAIDSAQKPAAGNGNSNARILGHVLKRNAVVTTVNISKTGLDDDGIREISQDSSTTPVILPAMRTLHAQLLDVLLLRCHELTLLTLTGFAM